MRQYDLAAAQVAVQRSDEPEACGNRFRAAEQWGRIEKTGKRYLAPGFHLAPGLPTLLPYGPTLPCPGLLSSLYSSHRALSCKYGLLIMG